MSGDLKCRTKDVTQEPIIRSQLGDDVVPQELVVTREVKVRHHPRIQVKCSYTDM